MFGIVTGMGGRGSGGKVWQDLDWRFAGSLVVVAVMFLGWRCYKIYGWPWWK
jgi:hypothetical protein